MTSWFPYALGSLFFFGLWGTFNQIAVTHIDTKSALFYQALGIAFISFFTLSTINFKPALDVKGVSSALLTGIVYGIGCLFYFVAASRGKISTVVTLTALYPIVTIAIAFFLFKETINLKQFLGVILALIAMVLMAA